MPHPATKDSGLMRLRRTLRVAEQRSRSRYPTCRGATIRRCDARAEESQPAVVCDVSETGVGLMVFGRVAEDTLLLLEFDDAPLRPRVARVVHATENRDGTILGCELEQVLTPAELDALRMPDEWSE